MSRTTPTILCNLCMVEDLENGKLFFNTAHLKRITGQAMLFQGATLKKERV